MRKGFIVLVIVCWLGSPPTLSAQAKFKTEYFTVSLDGKGFVNGLLAQTDNREYLATSGKAPLLTLRIDGELVLPFKMDWNARKSLLQLQYPMKKTTAQVKVNNYKTYLTFELVKVTSAGRITLCIWGPYPTTIRETIGETVGVVRNRIFGIGIQSLNVKTLGGYPDAEDDSEPSFDIFATHNLADISDSLKQHQLYRGQTARITSFGSVLQAYCRTRDKQRIISNWGYDHYVVPSYNREEITGSKIAIFGVPEDKILKTIGRIEQQQGLPHPELDGQWAKMSPAATGSYLIMDFGEKSIDSALQITRRAGLNYLYQGAPFETWGHFKLKQELFPDNWESLKRCVEKADAYGIKLGIHTLSDFITPNDPYVMPVPDERLACIGHTLLSGNMDKESKEIPIRDPVFFKQYVKSNLHAAVIGDEIIRYRALSDTLPWKLLDCVRGAYGTTATVHKEGDTIGMLMDHGYKVFLASVSLQQEMAVTLANLFNKTGLHQISFDGLEGCWSSGMGQYACQLFVKTWYDHLKPALKGKVINDASMPGHFFWHIFTRMNWGEPWYAGFRESQTQYRLKNQEYFHRNYIPAMLGWFSMTGQTSLGDMEWLLARAAGFDAGFALVTNWNDLRMNGRSEEMLATIKSWETARMSRAFTPSQKERLKDIHNEFHLAGTGPQTWKLTPLNTSYFSFQPHIRQPGEPDGTTFIFHNPYADQPLRFILTFEVPGNDTSLVFENPLIEVNDYAQWRIPVKMQGGDILQSATDGSLKLYDRNWQLKREIQLDHPLLKIVKGDNQILFNGTMKAIKDAKIKIELSTAGESELVTASSVSAHR